MKSSPLIRFAPIVICAVLVAAAYWAGYVHGGRTAESSLVSTAGKKDGNSARNLSLAAGGKAGAAETLDSLMAGSVHPNTDLLAQWAGNLSLQECLDNMKKLQDLPAGLPRDAILKALVDAWAGKDPKGFLAGADGIVAPKLREKGVEKALTNLAAASAKEALDWISQNADNASNADIARRMAAAIGGYATVDPQGALNAVLALGDGSSSDRQIKTKAIEGLASSLADQGRFTDALALFNQLPANKLQNDGLAALVDTWAQVAPQNAASYIATVSDAGLVNDLGQSLTDVWAATDPAAAAKWAVQMDLQTATAGPSSTSGNNNNNGDTLLAHVVDSWAKYDLTATGQFLNQLPPSATKDAAIVSFVARAAQDNPADTMKWVATVSDQKLKENAFMQTAKQWNKQDPAAFNQFMATTTALTDAQKQAVANAFNNNGKGNPQN